MSIEEIALFIIMVFLFIIAIYLFVMLRKSHEKKQHPELKTIEFKDIVDITPEFKFETSGLNNVDIHQIKDLMKPVKHKSIAETDTETLSIEEKIRRQKRDLKTIPEPDNKIHEIKYDIQDGKNDEIPKTELNILDSHSKEDISVSIEMMGDVSGLKLEDTVIGIEEEKKRHGKTATKKADSTIKKSIVSPAKPLIREKAIKKIEPKKKSLQEEEKVIQKEAPGEVEKPEKKRVRKKKAVKQEQIKQEPVIQEPVIQEPVIQEPIIQEPVKQELVIQEPVIQEPVIPVIQEPVIQEPVIQEPVIQEPVIQEPVIQEPVIQEPVIQEPVIQEPVKQEPVKQKPVKHKTVKHKQVKQEPVVVEPGKVSQESP